MNSSPLEKLFSTLDRTLTAWHIWLASGFGAGQLCNYAAQGFHNIFCFGEYFTALQRHYIFSFEEE